MPISGWRTVTAGANRSSESNAVRVQMPRSLRLVAVFMTGERPWREDAGPDLPPASLSSSALVEAGPAAG